MSTGGVVGVPILGDLIAPGQVSKGEIKDRGETRRGEAVWSL